jgi:rubredoxin
MTADTDGGVRCPGCGREVWVLRKPRYDGFKKTGEDRVCASCGFVFPEGDGEMRAPAKPVVFGDADRSAPVRAFEAGEADRLCRHCRYYVVNPFRQWCGIHRRDVEATDTCGRFEAPPPPDPPLPGNSSVIT